METNKVYFEKKIIDTNNYLFADVDKSVTKEWASFPIIIRDPTVNGIYNSYDDFRNNNIQPADFSLGLTSDSTYKISFSQSNRYFNIKRNSFYNIWAISYHGNLFLPIMGKFFLPLLKADNRFYFYVPRSLHNMQDIILNGYNIVISNDVSGYTIGSHDNLMMYNNNSKVAALGAIIGFIQDLGSGPKGKTSDDMNILNKIDGNNEMRYCFLDMDNGDIIYY